MVIHDETELVVKLPMIKKPLFEDKSHVVPTIYEEDYVNADENDAPMSKPTKKSQKLSKNDSDVQVRVPRKKKTYSAENNTSYIISTEDLKELRDVYKKCKSVIKKIETKYGHLLDLDEPGPSRKRRITTTNSTDDEESECHCTLNKKIVFDDDGKEIAIETASTDHICPKKSRYSQPLIPQSNDLQIEYYNQTIELPDNLPELQKILQNPEIEVTYRNQVIQKVRLLRQEITNDIKFNKHSLIEKIKTNMDEIIDFKGTNLSVLPGYVY